MKIDEITYGHKLISTTITSVNVVSDEHDLVPDQIHVILLNKQKKSICFKSEAKQLDFNPNTFVGMPFGVAMAIVSSLKKAVEIRELLNLNQSKSDEESED
jgi:hypothetical protein